MLAVEEPGMQAAPGHYGPYCSVTPHFGQNFGPICRPRYRSQPGHRQLRNEKISAPSTTEASPIFNTSAGRPRNSRRPELPPTTSATITPVRRTVTATWRLRRVANSLLNAASCSCVCGTLTSRGQDAARQLNAQAFLGTPHTSNHETRKDRRNQPKPCVLECGPKRKHPSPLGSSRVHRNSYSA